MALRFICGLIIGIPMGFFILIIGPRVVYDSQSKIDAPLSTDIKDGQWMWRHVRSDMLVEIQSKLWLVPIGGQDTP
jgi:hypothetical protein